jgi:hypothetical protein
MNEQLSFLVCAKVKDLLIPAHESVRGVCAQCDEAVWISAIGQQTIKNSSDLKPTCWDCSIKSAGQNEHLKAALAPNTGDLPNNKPIQSE